MKKILLHTGFHKTGTTSIQSFLAQNRRELLDHGFCFYSGWLRDHNHVEIALSVLRESLDAPIKKRFADFDRDECFKRTRENIEAFLSEHPSSTAIFSNETISFIRRESEAELLKELFPADWVVEPVTIMRNKEDWLISFRRQMEKMGVQANSDASSCGYFSEDSWLLDHERFLHLMEAQFGRQTTFNYDREMVGRFLDIVGLGAFPREELYENKSKKTKQSRLFRFLRS